MASGVCKRGRAFGVIRRPTLVQWLVAKSEKEGLCAAPGRIEGMSPLGDKPATGEMDVRIRRVSANANPSRMGALWEDYSFTEGWAHYTEEMMYDAGLGAGQPEMRIGMLTNALLRDVRFLSAICLHSGCMSLAESEAMFRERAFADAGNARQQALRGTYDPGYLAYTLGKLMIRKLRADWLAAHPGATAQQFHDKFLSFGSPPVPLVRQQMLGDVAGAL